MAEDSTLKTTILPVDPHKIGRLKAVPNSSDLLDELSVELDNPSEDARNILQAAEQLRSSDNAVAFPTETVYGLGGDATRSAAVKSIFRAKQRPVDNPLIVHVASLKQLRDVLSSGRQTNGYRANGTNKDPIPTIYHPLIKMFWPGPLTIILQNPPNSPLAPEVTAGLNTFGVRMPRHVLALALIKLADVPVAAPSANASTKPSPTAAEHVAHDLNGRIETIIDGGPCDVGVESTVVDGLSDPPLILRPGGISIEQIRSVPGWENTQIGYKNTAETGSKPKAPGMKYRHYSPKATVILFEAGRNPPTKGELQQCLGPHAKLGLVRTKNWTVRADSEDSPIAMKSRQPALREPKASNQTTLISSGFSGLLDSLCSTKEPRKKLNTYTIRVGDLATPLLDISLGPSTADIARGIFAALRELDMENVDTIIVEGIDDAEGDTAAAIMNRLRKASEIRLTN